MGNWMPLHIHAGWLNVCNAKYDINGLQIVFCSPDAL